MIEKSERIYLTLNAIRWVSNILVELLSNNGSVLPPEAREALRIAVEELEKSSSVIRRSQR